MSKHTPGPWNAFLDQAGADHICIETETESVCNVIWTGSAERQLTNARLIAAAPDMLDALERMVEVHDELCRFDHHGCCQAHYLDEGDQCRVAQVRAVIAKAKGEAP